MRNQLNWAQRLALLGITRCFRTTSTEALQVLAVCLPLDLQVEFNMAQLRRFRKVAQIGNTKIVPWEVEFPVSSWGKHPAEAQSIDWEETHPNSRGVEVFTDGSKFDGEVGAGVAIYRDGRLIEEQSFRLPDNETVFQAELVSILKGLELLNACDVVAEERVKLFSDSRSSLHALGQPGSTNPLVVTIHSRRAKRNIVWNYIRAHVGTVGNEKADALANAGTVRIGIDFPVLLSLRSAKSKL